MLFTSANAVRFAHQLCPLPWPDKQVHAIGTATEKALVKHQQTLARPPQPPFNSEAFLDQISDDRPGSLLIVKGLGGRDLIQSQLIDCGWQVSSVAVYERQLPVVSASTVDAVFDKTAPDIVSVSSNETLGNLWTLCQQHTSRLKLIPLVVNSERCAQFAKELGFQRTTLVANPAGDEGQLACLAQWKMTRFDTHRG